MPLRLQFRNADRAILTVRNAVFTTFFLLLITYPVFDRQLHLGAMGAMNPILIYTILALGLNIVVGFAGLLDLGYAAFFAIGGETAAFFPSPPTPLPFSPPPQVRCHSAPISGWRWWRAGSWLPRADSSSARPHCGCEAIT